MREDSYWRSPKQINEHAWWYVNLGSIEIHADVRPGDRHLSFRIPRKALLEYIKRSGK